MTPFEFHQDRWRQETRIPVLSCRFSYYFDRACQQWVCQQRQAEAAGAAAAAAGAKRPDISTASREQDTPHWRCRVLKEQTTDSHRFLPLWLSICRLWPCLA